MDQEYLKNLIKDILEKASFEVKDISIDGDFEKNTILSLDFEKSHLFTGKDGEGLHSLNYIYKRILEKNNEEMLNKIVLLDINGFHKKHIDSIKAIAHMMAERARYFKSSVELEPMSSFDRRIVHEFLADASDIKTESVGEGRDRKVLVKYIGSI
jgi:spoIIIJ-associated protein